MYRKILFDFRCLVCVGLVAFTPLVAEDGGGDGAAPLLGLVDAALSGAIAAKEHFVSFEETVLLPSPQGLPTSMKLKDGREVQIKRYANRYYSVSAVDGKCVAAFSSKNAMREPAFMLQAEQLYGYDGSVYWYLELTHPFRIMERGGGGGVIEQRNILSIFPASESGRELGAYPADIGLITHLSVVKICYSVLQLGCEDFSRSIRRSSTGGAWILERGGTSGFTTEGDGARPRVFDYRSSDGAGARVIMDYAANEMTIEKFSNSRNPPFSKVIYRIVGFGESDLLSKGRAHHWKTHVEPGENLLIHTVEKGIRTEVTRLNGDALQEVAVVEKPEVPLYSRRVLIFSCIAFITAMFAVIVKKHKKGKNEKI